MPPSSLARVTYDDVPRGALHMPLDLVGSLKKQNHKADFWPNEMDLEGCETERKMDVFPE